MNRAKLAILFTLLLPSLLIAEVLRFNFPALHPLLYLLLASLIFMLIFVLFDRLLWRFLPTQPHIHGKWLGRLSSSYSDNSDVEPFTVFITQHWLTTRIDFDSSFSKSSSVASIFFRNPEGEDVLSYIYLTEPYEGSQGKAKAHFGLTVLHLKDDGRLVGYYHHLDEKGDGYEYIYGQLVMMRPEQVKA